MFKNKLISKLFALTLLFFSVNIFALPIQIWFGKKNDKFAIVVADLETAEGAQPQTVYDIDSKRAAPTLMSFFQGLSQIPMRSNLVFLQTGDENYAKGYLAKAFNPMLNLPNKDSLNSVANLSLHNKKINNLTFKNLFNDSITGLIFHVFVENNNNHGTAIPNIATKISFLEFTQSLQNTLDEISNFYKSTSMSAEANEYFKNLYNKTAKQLNDFENNNLIKALKDIFGNKDLKIGVFLKLLDIISEASSSFDKTDLAYKIINVMTKNNPKSLIDKLKKQKINWLEIYSNFIELCLNMQRLYALTNFVQSLNDNRIVIGYFNEIISSETIDFLKKNGFKTTFQKNYKTQTTITVETIPQDLVNILNNIHNEEEIKSNSQEDLPTKLSPDLTSEQIKQISNEIRINHPMIKNAIEKANLTIESLLENHRYEFPFTKNKMNLLMLAASEIPSSPRLIQMLLDGGVSADVKIYDNEINRREIPKLIGFDAAQIAQAALDMQIALRDEKIFIIQKQIDLIEGRTDLNKIEKEKEIIKKEQEITKIRSAYEYSNSLVRDVINRLKRRKVDRELSNLIIENDLLKLRIDTSVCNVCRKDNISLSSCAGCKAVKYCGVKCQRDDRSIHKPVCLKIAQNEKRIAALSKEFKEIEESIKPIASPIRETIARKVVAQTVSPKLEQETAAKTLTAAAKKKKKKKKKKNLPQITAFKSSDLPAISQDEELSDEENIEVNEPQTSETTTSFAQEPTQTEESKSLVTQEVIEEEESKEEAPWETVERRERVRQPKKLIDIRNLVASIRPEISTGRTLAKDPEEFLAMLQVRSNPEAGQILDIELKDPNWIGWRKRRQNVNGVEIHYLSDRDRYADFKFKD